MAGLRDFLRGGLAGGAGVSRGLLRNLLMEREEAEKQRQEKLKLPYYMAQTKAEEARAGYYGRGNQPKPEKEPTAKELLEQLKLETILGLSPDEQKKALLPDLYKEPERSKNITGAPSFEDLLKGRRTATEKAQKDYQNRYSDLFESFGLGDDFDFRKFNKEKNMPVIKDLMEELKILGDRPDYQIPTGDALVALSDSTEAARTDPAILAALMNFEPGQQEDQEIQKAKAKLKSGEWDQAKYNAFVEWYNAQR